MMKRMLLLMAGLILLAALAGSGDGKTFLIHAKTALQQGYKVVILFDASGVTALKKGGLFGGDKTPLDKAALPERERTSLTEQLGVPLEGVPHDYGEYIRFLKSKGVELYANRTTLLLYKIGEDEIEAAVTPVGLEKMLELFARVQARSRHMVTPGAEPLQQECSLRVRIRQQARVHGRRQHIARHLLHHLAHPFAAHHALGPARVRACDGQDRRHQGQTHNDPPSLQRFSSIAFLGQEQSIQG
jgi:predicted peroxiredoxin